MQWCGSMAAGRQAMQLSGADMKGLSCMGGFMHQSTTGMSMGSVPCTMPCAMCSRQCLQLNTLAAMGLLVLHLQLTGFSGFRQSRAFQYTVIQFTELDT
jgi:hypothetical protein